MATESRRSGIKETKGGEGQYEYCCGYRRTVDGDGDRELEEEEEGDDENGGAGRGIGSGIVM